MVLQMCAYLDQTARTNFFSMEHRSDCKLYTSKTKFWACYLRATPLLSAVLCIVFIFNRLYNHSVIKGSRHNAMYVSVWAYTRAYTRILPAPCCDRSIIPVCVCTHLCLCARTARWRAGTRTELIPGSPALSPLSVAKVFIVICCYSKCVVDKGSVNSVLVENCASNQAKRLLVANFVGLSTFFVEFVCVCSSTVHDNWPRIHSHISFKHLTHTRKHWSFEKRRLCLRFLHYQLSCRCCFVQKLNLGRYNASL